MAYERSPEEVLAIVPRSDEVYVPRSVAEAKLLLSHASDALRDDALNWLVFWAERGLAAPHKTCAECSAGEPTDKGTFCHEVDGYLPEHAAEGCACFEQKEADDAR